MADHLQVLEQLQANDPQRTRIKIHLIHFRTSNQVAALALALQRNEYVDEFEFRFYDSIGGDPVNWVPLLREIESRQKLKKVEIVRLPNRRLAHLFNHQFFQSLQRNTNVQSLSLSEIHFAPATNSHSDAIVFFLDNAQALTDLTFVSCGGLPGSAYTNIAAALARNNRIQHLHLKWCHPTSIARPIFQSLASSDSNSSLTELEYRSVPSGDRETAEGFQQYLESPSATIQNLKLSDFDSRNHGPTLPIILRGLTRNTLVKKLVFENCLIGVHRVEGRQEISQQLATLLQSKPELTAWGFYGCDFFEFPIVSDAVVAALARRETSLRCFELDIRMDETNKIQIAVFRNVMTAVASNTRLQRLLIKSVNIYDAEYFQIVEETIQLFKGLELTLVFDYFLADLTDQRAEEEERVIEALKRNYMVQSVDCRLPDGSHRLSAASRSRLDHFLDRNRKLAQWVENPKLVPPELWSYATMLAMKAGINSLYQSLLALSEHGIGLQQRRGRKRKRPQYFKP